MAAVPQAAPESPLTAEGLWEQILVPFDAASPTPALFLDRDGVIVEEVGFLKHPKNVRIIAGAAGVIAQANRLGLAVVIVSNQSGIGRGLFDWNDFARVQARILAAMAAHGAVINGVFACPHHPEAAPPYRHPDHPARKPGPGLLLRAAVRLPIDLARSWIVGDRASDLAAGRNAGLAGGVLVATGFGGPATERQAALHLAAGSRFRVLLADAIGDVAATLPLFSDHRFDL